MEHNKTDRFVSPLWVTIWENGIEGGPECIYGYAAEYEPCIRRALREFLFQNFQSDDLMPRLSLPDEPEMEAALRAKVHTARLSTCISEDQLYAAVELELSSSLTPEEETSFEEALESLYNGVFGEEVELLEIFTEQGVELCARLCHEGLEFFYQEESEFRQAGSESPSEEQAKSNPILKLASELRQHTYGMCDIGIGPWGYGVNTLPLTKVGTVVCMDPDPNGETPLPSEVKEYTVTLRPIRIEQNGVRGDNTIREEELQRLCEDPDVMTRLVANALREMSAVPVTVSKQEDMDAFNALYEADLRHTERLTAEEAQRLEVLRWYETKTPEEIVDFQLSVKRLCMPMEQFWEAAEAVFHHPVTAETLDDCRMELLQERRIMLAVSACKARKAEPVITPPEDACQTGSPQSFGPVLG